MNIHRSRRKAALRARKNSLASALSRRRGIGLPWWERLAWAALAGLAGTACALLTGCGHGYSWGELSPEQRQAWRAADRAFHRWSGEPAAVTVAKGEK